MIFATLLVTPFPDASLVSFSPAGSTGCQGQQKGFPLRSPPSPLLSNYRQSSINPLSRKRLEKSARGGRGDFRPAGDGGESGRRVARNPACVELIHGLVPRLADAIRGADAIGTGSSSLYAGECRLSRRVRSAYNSPGPSLAGAGKRPIGRSEVATPFQLGAMDRAPAGAPGSRRTRPG